MNQRFSSKDRGQSSEDRQDGGQSQSGYAEQRGKQFDPLGWGEANPASPSAGEAGEPGHDSDRQDQGESHLPLEHSDGNEESVDAAEGTDRAGAAPNQGFGQGRESFGDPPQRGSGLNVGVGEGNSLSSATSAPLQGFRGEGPKGFQRSDQRLQEDIRDRLMDDDAIDASDVSVQCKDGVITLEGTVSEPRWKHRIEDLVAKCHGVSDIENRITIKRGGDTARDNGADRGPAPAESGGSPGQKQRF